MIKGIGIDIVEINRITEVLTKQPKFVDRILSDEEKNIYLAFTNAKRQIEWFAGRFAAKEAFSKALGTGIGSAVTFQDVVILNNPLGKPQLFCKGMTGLHVSISHEAHYAIAQVIIEENGE